MSGAPVRHAILKLAAAFMAALPVGSDAQQHAVSQKGRQFGPSTMTVKVGEAVVFRNDDNVYHNVFSLSPTLSFDLGVMPPGSARSVSMTRTGVVDVECAIHPQMKLEIKVVK